MRKEINFNLDWLFHKGDIKVPRPLDKGPVYTQSKIERRLMGPAAYNYIDVPRFYQAGVEIRNDGWEKVDLPHDYVVDQDNDPTQNNAHGYFRYENAWYRKHFPDSYGRVTAYDKDMNSYFLGREKTWKHVAEREYMVGMYQWVAIDYRGESNWPVLSSRSGSIDLFLQKKSGFYLNRAHWTDEPMVHIVPHWNFKGIEGERIKVTVYTNCDELELFLNGESLGRKQIEKYGRGEWGVPYAPGALRVEGYRNGERVAEDERVTTGAPCRLRLTQNAECMADGSQCALFTCEALDEHGRAVPDASEFVEFFTTGGAKIVGTGSDICDHTRVTEPRRKMYMGKISVAVRPAANSEGFELYAKSDRLGLCKAVVKLK